METPPVIAEVLRARDQQLQARIQLLVSRYRQNWGDSLWRQAATLGGKPLIVALDFYTDCNFFLKFVLEKYVNCRVFSTENGLDMLVKVAVLRPALVISGLNVLHACPIAYEWILWNADQPEDIAIPVVIFTGASESRWAREAPTWARSVRVLSKSGDGHAIRAVVQELIGHS